VADAKLALAESLGAELTVNAARADAAATIQEQVGGAHGALVTAVTPRVFRDAINMLRRRGTCVLIGLPPGDFPTPIFDVVVKRITIRGSVVGTRKDLQESLQFAAEGKAQPNVELQPLDAVNTVLDRLKQGAVNGRVVLNI
jgi:propanol-preferring alcohol dehydrogenase